VQPVKDAGALVLVEVAPCRIEADVQAECIPGGAYIAGGRARC
jgi:hypothetical protein